MFFIRTTTIIDIITDVLCVNDCYSTVVTTNKIVMNNTVNTIILFITLITTLMTM